LGFANWNRYNQLKGAFHIVKESPIWPNFFCCTCSVGIKKSPCKHSVMLMKEKGMVNYPPDAVAEPLGQKRKRGRPTGR